ncbi:LON peptidase N-terminal domain and RING finger protein 3 [Geodia barretti]|nr:LON peptidase N-terminal domain and RING finger protein 3 [Geodia barretti]
MSGKMNVDELLERVLHKHFRAACEEKRRQKEAERAHKLMVGVSESEELPVFVCTMAFPSLPCPLHVFEPQYRLMLRRCVESGGRRFGMCYPIDGGSFSSYGTVLYINTVEHTADGRSLITTTGEKRFEVLHRSTCDGYNTGMVRFIEDEPVTNPWEIVSLRSLQEEVFDHAKQWLEALPVYARLLLTQTVCCPLPGIDPHPENCPSGPMWVWWYVNALPTNPQRKIAFLKLTSLRERLLMLKDSLHLPIPTVSANGYDSREVHSGHQLTATH